MNTSTLIGDIARWIFTTAVMVALLYFSLLGIFYSFEFILTKLINFNTFIYLILWAIAIVITVKVYAFIVSFIVSKVMLLVRQKLWFGNIFGTIYLFSIIALMVAFWASWFEFGWETAQKHQTLNKWVYSAFLLGMMIEIPLNISKNYTNYLQKQTSNM